MAEHTPGPWEAWSSPIGEDSPELDWTVSAKGQVVVDVASVMPHSIDAEANARLIAAAPELLEACVEVEHNLRQGAMCPEDLDRLRAAITKATKQE